ncbi:MAG: N-acetylneuraminate synthase family protein [Brevinematia bacterium]
MFDFESFKKSNKVLIVAEIGINHNGDFSKLIKLIEKSKESGADAVKFQIFSKTGFYIQKQYLPEDILNLLPLQVFEKAFLPCEKYEEAFEYAKNINLLSFATPLDLESFEFLKSLDVPIYKIASSDINYTLLLKEISKTKKVAIISTGFSTIDEVKKSIKLLKGIPTVVMFCVSRYPSEPEDISINEFIKFKKVFEEPKNHKLVGFSDHTKTLSLPIAFSSLGARVIEKHITLDENDDSFDNIVSINPEKFKIMVEMIREIEISLSVNSRNLPDKKIKEFSFRSFVAKEKIQKNTKIKEKHLEALRPGIFIESNLENLRRIKKKVKYSINPGQPIKEDDLW